MTETEELALNQKLAQLAAAQTKQALRLASASLPHLSGLARLCRVITTESVPVAAIGASGLIAVHPNVFAKISLADATFIIAHEMMHLALDTHGRIGEASPLLGNYAHDYIINDILCNELDRETPPLDGLSMPSAREKSFEELVVELSKGGTDSRIGSCWTVDSRNKSKPGAVARRNRTALGRALCEAGIIPPQPEPLPPPPMDERVLQGDLLPPELEQQLEPNLSSQARGTLQQKIRKAAAKAAALAELKKKIQDAQNAASGSAEPERHDATLDALRGAYETPWQMALQRWVDAVAPGERTYARPSRRGANRSDVILPGRRREGWTLHIILDTSGSMEAYLSRALGAIAYFCESSGVYDVHLIQCDVEVTKDDWVEPGELDRYQIRGFGYSDMTPAMLYFAENPEITSVVMLTDGYIDILEQEPPYRILWVLLGEMNNDFQPAYGDIVHLPLS